MRVRALAADVELGGDRRKDEDTFPCEHPEERAPACGQRIAATAIATASPFIAVSAEYLENRRIGKSPASAFCE